MPSLRNQLAAWSKRILFPGLDLHLRARRVVLAQFLLDGPGRTLDAGCGNGALSFEAAKGGHQVLALSNDEAALKRARLFFKRYEGLSVAFECRSLYDLHALADGSFDQVVCSEVLEHLSADESVVEQLVRVLRDGGRLIACVPFRLHPEHNLGRVNEPENGDHVRDGYTIDELSGIVSKFGLTVVHSGGFGGSRLARADRALRGLRSKVGEALAIPAFLALTPVVAFDDPRPAVPFSVYVVADKVEAGV